MSPNKEQFPSVVICPSPPVGSSCTRLRHRSPTELPKGILRWVGPVLSLKSDEVRFYAGLDGCVALTRLDSVVTKRP
jgi:hypothetical protein